MSAQPADARARAADPKKVHIADTAITRQNWYKHVNWLNVTFIIGIPVFGCIQALFVPLQLKTAIWAVIYYFFTGLGITAGEQLFFRTISIQKMLTSGRLPSSMGSLLLLRHSSSAYLARCRRWWCC
jgi:hypothetical protein